MADDIVMRRGLVQADELRAGIQIFQRRRYFSSERLEFKAYSSGPNIICRLRLSATPQAAIADHHDIFSFPD
jgi:hypothetical protein